MSDAKPADVADGSAIPEEARPTWRNWSGEQVCKPTRIARPFTREGLALAVVEADARGERIKVAGSGHSFSPAALTEGTMIDISSLDRILDVDPASGLVRVEAGAVLGDLSARLDRLGLAFENLGDIDKQTLAGSISTATHGTGARFQNVSAQIESLELIAADGTTRILDERSDPTGFRAARVGLGALGAIYAATIRTVPVFTLSRVDHPLPLRETLDSLEGRIADIEHFEFYVFPHTETALCRESRRTDEPPEPASQLSRFTREIVLENWVSGTFSAIARHRPSAGPWLARRAADSFARVSKVDRSHRVFASERRIKFTEMEYAIPIDRAREAVEGVLEIASRPEMRCVFPIEVRFVGADDALLSPSHERDSCYIAVHQDRKLDWRRYFGEVEKLLASFEGRPHWGKRHTRTAAELAGLYPRWSAFAETRARFDPGGRFANAYTDRVLGRVIEKRRR